MRGGDIEHRGGGDIAGAIEKHAESRDHQSELEVILRHRQHEVEQAHDRKGWQEHGLATKPIGYDAHQRLRHYPHGVEEHPVKSQPKRGIAGFF